MLQKRPTWQTEWAEMTEHGQPLPNEMIVLSSITPPQDNTSTTRSAETTIPNSFCFVPVVKGKKVVRMIVAPVLQTDGGQILGTPKVFDEEGIDKNSVARSFIGLGVVKEWHDKGYELNVELTPTPKQPTRGIPNVISEYHFMVIIRHNLSGFDRYELLRRGENEILQFKPSFSDPKSIVAYLQNEPTYKLTLSAIDEANPHDYMASLFWRELVIRLRLALPYQSRIEDIYVAEGLKWSYTDDQSNGADNTAAPTTPFPFATYFVRDLPYTIEPQELGKNYCAIAIIAFLRKYYGLPEMTQEEIAKDYVAKLNPRYNGKSIDVETQGMQSMSIMPYVEMYFNTITGGGVSYDTMAAKHYLLMSEIAQGVDMMHAVLIIGYEKDKVVYFDPLDGRQHKTEDSNFAPTNRILITGAK